MMEFTRRQFIKVAAGTVILQQVPPALATTRPTDVEGLPQRILGKTRQAVTIVGLGGAWIAQDPAGHPHSEAETRAIIDAALEGGIRYFDTAPNYVNSEQRLGPALAGVRDRVFLTTKLDHRDAAGAEKDLMQSLKLLRTDHVDLLLLHGLGLSEFGDLDAVQGKGGALEFLLKAREKKLTRFIGFSSHPQDMASQRTFAAAHEIDVIQPFINYLSRAQNKVEDELVAFASEKRIGVIAMKVLGGDGQLAGDYNMAFRYALSVPGVHCALIGAATVQQVKRAVQAASEFRPLTDAEMKHAIAEGQRLRDTQSKAAAMLDRHGHADLGSISLA